MKETTENKVVIYPLYIASFTNKVKHFYLNTYCAKNDSKCCNKTFQCTVM